MQRRSLHRALLAVAAMAGGLVLATSGGGSASAAVVNQTMDCGLGGNQTMKIDGVYPSTVPAGGTYTVDLTPQPGVAEGAAIKNLVWYFVAPAGSTPVAGSASIVANGSTTSGTMGAVSASINGSVIQLRVPGEIKNGATFTNPTIRFQLRATGAAGTVLSVKAQANPAYTLTAAGSLSVSCKTTGAAASFTSTTIQAAPTTTTGSTTSTTAGATTTGSTTSTTAAPVVTTQTWSPVGGCGSVQSTVAPAGTTSVTVSAVGGNGGKGVGQGGGGTSNGGLGGSAVGTFAATPGQVYSAIVGCNGPDGGDHSNSTPTAGYGKGGGTGQGTVVAGVTGTSGGAGGGASAVCLGVSCVAGAGVTPLAVAGGGGGGGTSNCSGTPSGSGGRAGGSGTTSGAGGSGPSGANGGVGGNTGAATGGGSAGAGGANSSGGSADGGSSPNGDAAAGWGLSVVGGGGGGGFVGGAQGGNTQWGCKGAGGGGGGSSWLKTGVTNSSFGTSAGVPGVVVTFSISDGTTTTTPPSCTPDVVPFASSSALVDRQHRDFIGRAPTSGENSTWVGPISDCTKTADQLIESLIPADQTLTDARLVRIYHAYFKRAPDPSGFEYWTRQLGNGRGIIVVAQKFAESSEFRTTYGSLDNGAFVDLVYRNVLGRDSEPSGKAFWVGRLDRGVADRGTVMTNFSEANENVNLKKPIVQVWRAIRVMRQAFPTNSEFTTLTTPILAGTSSVEAAIKTIRTSAGYAARF